MQQYEQRVGTVVSLLAQQGQFNTEADLLLAGARGELPPADRWLTSNRAVSPKAARWWRGLQSSLAATGVPAFDRSYRDIPGEA